jgi:SAM-dependent methyltransferase
VSQRFAIATVALAVYVLSHGAQIGRAQTQARPESFAAQRHSKLYSPLDLGLLESPDRAAWQKPDQIMDSLKIAEGTAVAEIGAGGGWFTIRLARRVGPNGTVYAEDVQRLMLEAIRRRVNREGLRNVIPRLGSGSNTNMYPKSLDAALMVDSYAEVEVGDRVALLRNLTQALKPNGLIGIVNWKPGESGPGPNADARVPREVVEADARTAHLRVKAHENLPYQYLLVLAP